MRFFPFILMFLIACSPPAVVFENNKEVFVEIPQTKQDFYKGLSLRTSLEEDHGMIFIFDEEKNQTFWMKNMLFPLDLIFIDKNKVITNIFFAEPCKTDPCEIYGSKAMYVLEVNKGFAEKNDVKPGQKVKLKF